MPKPSLLPGAAYTDHFRIRLDHWPSKELALTISPAPPNGQPSYSVSPLSLTKYRDSWIVDVEGLVPDTLYRIGIRPPIGDDSTAIQVRTNPAGLTHELLLALFSCYFPSDQYIGHPNRARVILEKKIQAVPHLKIFMGDQIYGDVPGTTMDAEIYGQRYRQALDGSRLGNLLAYGANLFTCDDHEFWNSYPESAFWLARSGDNNWQRWARTASNEFFLNQGILNGAPGFTVTDPSGMVMNGFGEQRCWFSGTLSGLDLFMTDIRTDRMSRDGKRRPAGGSRSGRPRMLSDAQRDALLQWVKSVRRVGLLVLGQPLFVSSEYYDSAMSDYDEYEDLLAEMAQNLRQRDVTYIVLTGDIHWGRLVSLSPRHRPTSRLIEFCTSPVARVGLRSFFSESNNVGKRPSVNFRRDDYPEFGKFFRGFDYDNSFANNDNNFGILRLTEVAGHIQAGFELWSLDTAERAIDRWGTNNGLPCQRTIDLT